MEQIIKKAIEGGWRKHFYFSHFNGDEVAFGDTTRDSENNPCFYTSTHAILLDPLFWQSLGKAVGWKHTTPLTGENMVPPTWQYHALRFHEINLTEGWEQAVKYLQSLLQDNKEGR